MARDPMLFIREDVCDLMPTVKLRQWCIEQAIKSLGQMSADEKNVLDRAKVFHEWCCGVEEEK